MADLKRDTIIKIQEKDYQKKVFYTLSRNGLQMQYIGYVEIWDGKNLVYHANLTYRNYDEVKDLSDEEILKLATDEADKLVGEPLQDEIAKFVAMYEDAVAKGRYI